jgi:hypothetical protein
MPGAIRKARRPAKLMVLPISRELKSLIFQAADEAGMTMNEWVAKVCARALKRPELARIPRKRLGRPPLNGHVKLAAAR